MSCLITKFSNQTFNSLFSSMRIFLVVFVLSQFEVTHAQHDTLITSGTISLNAPQSDFYSILFTGNTSKGLLDDNLLKKWKKASQNTENTAFLILGNIYNPGENKYSKELFSGSNRPLLIVPGEKEWANGNPSGKELIKDIKEKPQEQYTGPVYMPDAACPGPKEVELSEHLVIILLDTYWWVHKYDRRYNKCGIETDSDILIQIEDAIRRHYSSKHVVIAGHQSLKSYGNSDGYFSLKQSILEAPYTLYRKTLGTRKDNHHPDFKEFRDALLSILEKYPNVIYVSASDANLQYFKLNNIHHIISGSMAKTGFVKDNLPEFASSEKGFARLDFSPEGDCRLVFTDINGELFRKIIYKKKIVSNFEQKNIVLKLPDSTIAKASSRYNVPKSKYFWIGENYRAVWNTPVKVPVFDIGNKKGGLHIIKRGGGQQTKSIRLEDENGQEYVLRSIEKDVKGALPGETKKSPFIVSIVQDQISASNPYAALVVAKLSEYAKILHTNPELVYVPDDFRFNIYRQDVANQLYIFEERPVYTFDVERSRKSENIISTKNMIEKMFDNKVSFIDSDAILRARLFDILINDWDRHEDQWRWAEFRYNEKSIYKPIPRDRDQAFFINDGVFPWIAKQKVLIPKIQGFDKYTKNIEGHAFNARYFDRTFLNQSEWKDWKKQIDSLKTFLTPERIDKAVLSFPEEVQSLCANQTAEILKARLKNMELMARQLYLFLAKEVDITGTNGKDSIEIFVPDDTTINITVYQLRNMKKTVIYNRFFYASETKQVRIYGLGNKDYFNITGKTKNKINLSIIGGDDGDEIIYNNNKVPRFITIYNKNREGFSHPVKKRIKTIYDDDELKYNREYFKYDIVYPSLFINYNRDDGIFLGGGPIINKFSRYHYQKFVLLGNYAFLTNAFNFHFTGIKTYPLKHFSLGITSDIRSPSFLNNYFGMGNETIWQVEKAEKEYYRIRIKEYYIKTDFVKFIKKDGSHKTGFGFFYKNTNVEASPDHFIVDFSQNGLDSNVLQPHLFTGVFFNYKLNTIPKQEMRKEERFGGSNMFRTRGILFETEIVHYIGLNHVSQDFTKVSGQWSSYLSFSQRPRIVYIIGFGGEKNFGNYVFNEAAKLGQKEHLRGYRRTRFYGDDCFYQNTEIRIRVKQFKTYILNGTAGLFIFNDIGRVWFDTENSSRWHDGYGGGLWWSPFDMALLCISYTGSKEDNLINVTINYQL